MDVADLPARLVHRLRLLPHLRLNGAGWFWCRRRDRSLTPSVIESPIQLSSSCATPPGHKYVPCVMSMSASPQAPAQLRAPCSSRSPAAPVDRRSAPAAPTRQDDSRLHGHSARSLAPALSPSGQTRTSLTPSGLPCCQVVLT